MTILETEARESFATRVSTSEDAPSADLSDGRTITVPLGWFPRLTHATPEQRANWRLIAGGVGIHWPDLDEDISAQSLWAGHQSTRARPAIPPVSNP